MTQSRSSAASQHCPSPDASRPAIAFDRFARFATRWAGSSLAFVTAFALVLGWAVSGPVFGYSQTWQLVINTGTTIVTFLMVFLIQQSQNKDSQAVHLKLDELLLALKGANDGLVDAENLDEAQLRKLAEHYAAVAKTLQGHLHRLDGDAH
ncbi:low affinity iron permease family protein [Bordetella holmesii]|uniref:Low affinity iron permease n=2 Tax=Bordetella holmesii TaxID=35814 RepID=A0A158M9H4_9BORD|nr:low affinity iron permease family protein [Bordetella holmesii]AHV92911.1 low affinity iron permease family protein [Bordetella holmesii ATCC 51541]AIT27408.1 low affinity iron permease family protein [Bordetella holmesii 44057]EWM41740.1 low affinity iron permease family protein [Bordetella holmesii 41130]EWM48000.1 low affinity iron permease family protein [Bordetella holmesii 35009]EWM48978.1 low affinity iron permease family protein [Bordetella holmesii 70147]